MTIAELKAKIFLRCSLKEWMELKRLEESDEAVFLRRLAELRNKYLGGEDV